MLLYTHCVIATHFRAHVNILGDYSYIHATQLPFQEYLALSCMVLIICHHHPLSLPIVNVVTNLAGEQPSAVVI